MGSCLQSQGAQRQISASTAEALIMSTELPSAMSMRPPVTADTKLLVALAESVGSPCATPADTGEESRIGSTIGSVTVWARTLPASKLTRLGVRGCRLKPLTEIKSETSEPMPPFESSPTLVTVPRDRQSRGPNLHPPSIEPSMLPDDIPMAETGRVTTSVVTSLPPVLHMEVRSSWALLTGIGKD